MMIVRKALPHDTAIVVSYIEKKAAFDRALNCFDGTLDDTGADCEGSVWPSHLCACSYLGIGRAACWFRILSLSLFMFQARPNLWLDDLFADVEIRRVGAGVAHMSALAKEATEHDYTHIAWTADAKNPSGIPFYTKIGATLISQVGSRLGYSTTPESLVTRIAEIQKPNT